LESTKSLFSRLIQNLSLDELTTLRTVIYDAITEIELKRVKRGDYPPLTQDELQSIKNREKIEVIKKYRDRTGLSLLTSKMVIDSHCDTLKI
jgi:hypothetical protein